MIAPVRTRQRHSFRALLAILLILTALPACALQLQLQLEGPRLTPEQQQATRLLLADTLATLPPAMRDALDRTVQVRWSNQLPEQVIGRATPSGRVLLNARWLPALSLQGSAADGHAALRHQLQGTLIHELTHLYDRGRYWPADQQRRQRHCRRRHQVQGDIGLPAECRGQTQRRFTLSDDPQLLDLAGWPQRVSTRGEREMHNHQQLRSPDRYEFHDPQEFVAVNMEYFLLDPEYACRRPALAAHLQAHFGWAPEHLAACSSSLPYLDAALDKDRESLGWLDPERIHEVHYLLAEADDSWAGRWGHSMLRLVICAPGRPRGPACMLDLQHHLVLSYRAFVDDVQLSSWDGLTGVYPSRLFVLPLQRVIDEYTRTELRGLSSVPLNLSRTQVEGLARQAVTQHWSYDGTYYFVSNNCTVETLKLLRSGSHHPLLLDLDSQTPYGLLQSLETRGLADTRPLQNLSEARRLGYQFDSYRGRYQQLFGVVREQLQVPQQSFGDWLAAGADQRRPWLKDTGQAVTAALMVLEHAALRQQVQHIQQDLKMRYLNGRHNEEQLREAGQLMQELLSGSGFLSRPADLLSQGYGLPQPADMEYLEQTISQHRTGLLDMADSLDEQVRILLRPEQRAELDSIDANISWLRERLRHLHQQSGGPRF